MTELFRATVGSRLYGIDTPESDHDRRGVKVSRLGDLLLSADVGKNTSTEDEAGDLTLYELNHFVRLLMKGNPTITEALYSLSLKDETLAGRFTPLLDSGEALKSLKGYITGAVKLYEKSPDTKKAWKNMAGGLTYIWLYEKFFGSDVDFEEVKDLVLGCRAGDAQSLSKAHLNLLVYRSMREDTAKRVADVEYAKRLLEECYQESADVT